MGVLGNHLTEDVCRETTHKPSGCTEASHAHRDVKAGASNGRHKGVASVDCPGGKKIDQCIAAAQEHKP